MLTPSDTQVRSAMKVVTTPHLFGWRRTNWATAWKTLMEARGLRVSDSRLGLASNTDRPAPNGGSAA